MRKRTVRILKAVGETASPEAQGPKPEPVLEALVAYRLAIKSWCEGEQRRHKMPPYLMVPGREHPEETAQRRERSACEDADKALFAALVKDLGYEA